MTKTDRILGYLPATFEVARRPSPLLTVVGTYGRELQAAENALAAVMRAHWVDHADRGAGIIDDLARMAALYGLAPRADDTVEEFRERLKRYVLAFLEGPSTVQGLMRLSAIVLGLRIDDSYAAIDAWWQRRDDILTTAVPSGQDAAPLLFGFAAAEARGEAAAAARLQGLAPLPETLDLAGAAMLDLGLDGGAPTAIDLAQGAPDPTAVAREHIVQRINDETGVSLASIEATRLVLTSPTVGAGSRLQISDRPDDAAPAVLGLAPRLRDGADARPASFTGSIDLSGGADLSQSRFLRLEIDGTHLAEIDVAGATPADSGLAEIVAAINAGLGIAVASDDGGFLTLTSPTAGVGSSIAFRSAAAQDARAVLFGAPPTVVVGSDAAGGSITGSADLGQGVDLRGRFNLALRLDGGGTTTVDCRGADPAWSELPEIIAAINAAMGATVARGNGRNLILGSTSVGPASRMEVLEAAEADASTILLGLPSRRASGSDATSARIAGSVEIGGPQNLWARRYLKLDLDGGPPRLVDLASHVADRGAASLAEIRQAIEAEFGAGSAPAEGDRLVFASLTDGAASSAAVLPLQTPRHRRFVSRAAVTDEASRTVLGFASAEAVGEAAAPARILGQKDLSRGVDLRGGRFLRLSVDGGSGIEVDCAGPRPRTTTLDEVVAALNAALGPVAGHDGKRLALVSPTAGGGSGLAFESPRATDALPKLLGVEPTTVRGAAAGRVNFAGTVDLSAGVDLSAADKLKLSVDGAAAVEISCAGPDPAITTLPQVVIAINVALGVNVANHDGRHLLLTSPSSGGGSSLDIQVPAGADATPALLGIAAPRSYAGAPATSARIAGGPDLSAGVDLSVARFLRLGVDATPPLDVDLAAASGNPSAATLAEIAAAINDVMGATVAADDGGHLVLTSPSEGLSSKVVLQPTLAGDARASLFGAVAGSASGADAVPAAIVGDIDLTKPVDLSERSLLRLGIDGAGPLDIDIAGLVPAQTFGDEILAAIEARLPGVASLVADGRLRLAAPTVGPASSIAVLPLRFIEVLDYAQQDRQFQAERLKHARPFFLDNPGAGVTLARVTFDAAFGVASPGLADLRLGLQLRLAQVVVPGARAEILIADDRLEARIVSVDGAIEPIAPESVLVGPIASQLLAPSAGAKPLVTQPDGSRSILVNHPIAPALVVLRRRSGPDAADVVDARVSDCAALPAETTPAGDLRLGRLAMADGALVLLDDADAPLTRLEPDRDGLADGMLGRRVAAQGRPIAAGSPESFAAAAVWPLFDVAVRGRWHAPAAEKTETFLAVTIGQGGTHSHLGLDRRVNIGAGRSELVRARTISKLEAVTLAQGNSRRHYLDCLGDRFDRSRFNAAHFAGGPCVEEGVFNASRFAEHPRDSITPVFAPAQAEGDLETGPDLAIAWQEHAPGTVAVNLPLDLPAAYGARFNQDRFALPEDAPERFADIVTEPATDADFLVGRINDAGTGSLLVEAAIVATVPIGFEAAAMPFNRPRALAGGRSDRAAQLFLGEAGLAGFVKISAKHPGSHGNRIAVAACKTGPGRLELRISFAGARFENARAVVLGPPLTGATEDLLRPGAVGVLQAKAAGVEIVVTRDGTPPEG